MQGFLQCLRGVLGDLSRLWGQDCMPCALAHHQRCLMLPMRFCSCLHTSGLRRAMEFGEPPYLLAHCACHMDPSQNCMQQLGTERWRQAVWVLHALWVHAGDGGHV